MINRPVAFPGTPDEARANRLTHIFDYSDADTRCLDCDCRPSHVAASYPCGARVPREVVNP